MQPRRSSPASSPRLSPRDPADILTALETDVLNKKIENALRHFACLFELTPSKISNPSQPHIKFEWRLKEDVVGAIKTCNISQENILMITIFIGDHQNKLFELYQLNENAIKVFIKAFETRFSPHASALFETTRSTSPRRSPTSNTSDSPRQLSSTPRLKIFVTPSPISSPALPHATSKPLAESSAIFTPRDNIESDSSCHDWSDWSYQEGETAASSENAASDTTSEKEKSPKKKKVDKDEKMLSEKTETPHKHSRRHRSETDPKHKSDHKKTEAEKTPKASKKEIEHTPSVPIKHKKSTTDQLSNLSKQSFFSSSAPALLPESPRKEAADSEKTTEKKPGTFTRSASEPTALKMRKFPAPTNRTLLKSMNLKRSDRRDSISDSTSTPSTPEKTTPKL